jgi:hypothetical protein
MKTVTLDYEIYKAELQQAKTDGTAIVKASANNLFSVMNVKIISNLRKMVFTN